VLPDRSGCNNHGGADIAATAVSPAADCCCCHEPIHLILNSVRAADEASS